MILVMVLPGAAATLAWCQSRPTDCSLLAAWTRTALGNSPSSSSIFRFAWSSSPRKEQHRVPQFFRKTGGMVNSSVLPVASNTTTDIGRVDRIEKNRSLEGSAVQVSEVKPDGQHHGLCACVELQQMHQMYPVTRFQGDPMAPDSKRARIWVLNTQCVDKSTCAGWRSWRPS